NIVPSAVKVKWMPPGGTGRSIPPATIFSPTQSPTIPISFFGTSFGAGAATVTASPTSMDVNMNRSVRVSVFLYALQSDQHDLRPGRRLEFLRPLLAHRDAQDQGVFLELIDADHRPFLLAVGRHDVDLGGVLLGVEGISTFLRLLASTFAKVNLAVGRE